MKYNPQIHHRRSIRLKGYDYSQVGLYFITICCQDRAHLFGKIENGEMILNEYGKIAHEEWDKTEKIRTNCRIHEFIIMPNHIHGIIEIIFKKENDRGESKFAPTEAPTEAPTNNFQSPSQTIGSIIRGFKIATIKRIKESILNNSSSKGELQFAKIEEKDKDSSTGELQFAPTAPTEKIKSLDFKLWQRNYYEHIIRSEKDYHRIAQYIINNPKKWDNDKLKNDGEKQY